MSFFKTFRSQKIPEECKGLEIRTESSTCTGEKIIGFYEPLSKKLLCSELVRSESDIDSFYKKYGLERPLKKDREAR